MAPVAMVLSTRLLHSVEISFSSGAWFLKIPNGVEIFNLDGEKGKFEDKVSIRERSLKREDARGCINRTAHRKKDRSDGGTRKQTT